MPSPSVSRSSAELATPGVGSAPSQLRGSLPKARTLRRWSEKPEYFNGLAEQILEQWAVHEEWVLQAKEREASPILTVRLEDLWSDSVETMSGVLRFLDLEMTDAFAGLVKQIVYPKDPNIKYASFPLPDVPRARRIMELYSY